MLRRRSGRRSDVTRFSGGTWAPVGEVKFFFLRCGKRLSRGPGVCGPLWRSHKFTYGNNARTIVFDISYNNNNRSSNYYASNTNPFLGGSLDFRSFVPPSVVQRVMHYCGVYTYTPRVRYCTDVLLYILHACATGLPEAMRTFAETFLNAITGEVCSVVSRMLRL